MRAAMFMGPKEISVIDYHLPDIGHNELLIKNGVCGLCKTDFQIYEGKAPSKPPIILGHEFSGEIISTGNKTEGFQIGDRVAINPHINCGYCDYCKRGIIQHCKNLKSLGISVNGGLSEYSIIPISQAYKFPRNFSYINAVYAEPLSYCINGIDRASFKIGDSIAIIGSGLKGLLLLQLAKLRGASIIIVVEPVSYRRKLAEKLGADFVIDPGDKNIFNTITEITNGGVDKVFECSGMNDMLGLVVRITRKGGTLIIFEIADYKSILPIDLYQLNQRQITIKASHLNPFTFQRSIDLLAENKINVEQFEVETLSLNTNELRKVFNKGRSNSVIKYIVEPVN